MLKCYVVNVDSVDMLLALCSNLTAHLVEYVPCCSGPGLDLTCAPLSLCPSCPCLSLIDTMKCPKEKYKIALYFDKYFNHFSSSTPNFVRSEFISLFT